MIHLHSYADVGVAAICERTVIRKGSLYHIFPNKQALTLEVLGDFWLAMKAGLVDQALRSDRPPLQRLSRFVGLAGQNRK